MRYLGMPDKTQHDWVEQLAASPYLKNKIDCYNEGELVQQLETRVAEILGKQSALFFPKGMVAQFCAFKAVEEKTGNNALALHPLSHIAFDEADSYRELLNLEGLLVGKDKPFAIDELIALDKKPAVVSVELPLRRAGFLLPEWGELCEISHWCKENKIHRHMDGARIWESTHFYQKPESDISALFDSVYVSLYKGIGALGGAILAGEEGFIEQCKIWRTRFGGTSYTLFPLVVTALDGLDNRHSKVSEYVERAKQIAELLDSFPHLDVPEPHTNGFLVFLSGDKENLNQKAESLSESMGMKLFSSVTEFPNSDKLIVEIQVGANHDEISNEEIDEYFKSWFK